MIDEPLVAVAPVMVTVLVPNVQAKLLAAEAARVILGPVPLQVAAVVELLTAGFGFTVIVISVAALAQLPVVVVAVTAYIIEPAALLLGFVNVWLIDEPLVAVAPVMVPVLVPKVQEKLLAALAVKLRLGLAPLQVEAEVALVIVGLAITVT